MMKNENKNKTIGTNMLLKPGRSSIVMIIAGLLLAGLMISCEDVLDSVPKSLYAVDNYYRTVDQADRSVIGAYDMLLQKSTYSYYSAILYCVDDDVSFWKRNDNDEGKAARYTSTIDNENLGESWIDYYNGLNRANICIEKIPAMDLYTNGTDSEQASLKRLYGEALLLRAIFSFDLVRFWGDVPYKTKSTDLADEIYLPNTPRSEIYDHIVADLELAKTLLPIEMPTTTERGNYGAVCGYLVRVLLHRAGYTLHGTEIERPDNYMEYIKEAAAEAKSLVEKNLFDLLPNYEDVNYNLMRHINDPTEIMFTTAAYGPESSSDNSSRIGTYIGPQINISSSYNRASANIHVAAYFKDEFDANDLRREVSVADWEIDKNDSIVFRPDSIGWFPGKWRRDLLPQLPFTDKNSIPVNWLLIRYSDVLLMLAETVNEARNELPSGVSLQDGIDAINRVRERAGLLPLGGEITGDQALFREAIRKERKLELCFEGWRKYDLIRWNELGPALRAAQEKINTLYPDELASSKNSLGYEAGYNFIDNQHILFPKPQMDLDANPNMEQNNGW